MPAPRKPCVSKGGIESSLHSVPEVDFGEDHSRARVGNAPENLALVSKLTNNLLQQEKTFKRGVKTRRSLAALDEDLLQKVLNLGPGIPEFIMRLPCSWGRASRNVY
jgi:hypothetical protein